MQRRLASAGAWAILCAAAVAQALDPLESWNRNHWGIEATATVRDCLACHEGRGLSVHASHPVEVDYAAVASRPDASLRPLEEALRRGVLLSDGKVHCYTCHDPRSPWRNHLALPPGSAARSAVVPGDESTYGADRPAPRPGDDVSPTPLCLACHAYD